MNIFLTFTRSCQILFVKAAFPLIDAQLYSAKHLETTKTHPNPESIPTRETSIICCLPPNEQAVLIVPAFG